MSVPLRILIVSAFFPPLNSIASLRPYSWAKYWAMAGHDVTVLTIERPDQGAVALKLPKKGFEVCEIPSWSPLAKASKGSSSPASPVPQSSRKEASSPGLLRSLFHSFRQKTGVFYACRMPDFTDLWTPSAKRWLHQQPAWDLVVSTSGPYAPHAIAYDAIKRKKARYWIADFRDFWVDHHLFKGIFPFTAYEKYLERKYIEAADAVTVVSPGMLTRFKSKYPDSNLHLIENGFDPEDLLQLDTTPYYPQDQKRRLVYTGTIQPGKRDPSPLFQAIKELSVDPVHSTLLERFEMLFAGPDLSHLDSLIDQHGVGRWVKNEGMKSRTDALRMQRDADSLLFLEWQDPSANYMLTGKLFEYLYSGKPLMALGVSEESDPGKLIRDAGAGMLCHDKESIKAFLIKRLSPSSPPHLPNSALLKKYERKELAEQLLNLCPAPFRD